MSCRTPFALAAATLFTLLGLIHPAEAANLCYLYPYEQCRACCDQQFEDCADGCLDFNCMRSCYIAWNYCQNGCIEDPLRSAPDAQQAGAALPRAGESAAPPAAAAAGCSAAMIRLPDSSPPAHWTGFIHNPVPKGGTS